MLFIWWLESLHFYVLTLPTSRRKNIIQRQDKYLHLLLWGMLALTPSQQSTSVNYLDSQCSKLASPGLAGYIREVPNPASTHSIKWKDKCASGGTGQGKEAWLKLTQSLRVSILSQTFHLHISDSALQVPPALLCEGTFAIHELLGTQSSHVRTVENKWQTFLNSCQISTDQRDGVKITI